MIDKETCEMIVGKYYDYVFRICFSILNDEQAAKDCTQEVFFLFYRKRGKLSLSEKIRAWLVTSAKTICRNYIKKNRKIQLEDIDKYENILVDKSVSFDKEFSEKIYEILDKEDADLLLEYIEADKGTRKSIAKRRGTTLIALYRKVDRLKSKVVKYYEEQ